MKKFCCFAVLYLLSVCLLLSGCEGSSSPDDTLTKPSSTSAIKTDDSVWYSEEAGVHGRIWLGMTEKEVYDILNKHNVPIKKANNIYECDDYGAQYQPPESYYKKCLYTEGHQFFYFNKEDQLEEICYFDQMHHTSDPVNDEFKAQHEVKRRGSYEDMITAYGEPYKVINLDSFNQSYVYHLGNGDYLHFVFQGTSTPIQSIHYCKYPYLFSY